MAGLNLYLFGTPRLEYEGNAVRFERRKALALAAYLALAEQPQSRDALAGVLWPELDNEHARSALRSTLRALTTPVPVEWIQADRATLALTPDGAWVDVNRFTGLLAQSASHAHDPDTLCEECVTRYRQAIELYRADFLAGYHLPDSVDFDDWQRMQSEWLRREFAGMLRRLAQHEAEAERYEAATGYARQWLALDELNEPAHRLLMRLFAASGQRSEALRQYQQCVEALNRELASPPEEETTRLYEAIQDNQLSKAQAHGASAAPSVSILPPLPALVVGRSQALSAIKQRVGIEREMRPVTVIQGWPGVGKSTIVAAIAHDPEIAQYFPDGILWASLGETPDIAGEIAAWADALQLGEPGRVRKVEDVSAQITAALREKRVLLIVDDVWQTEHAAPFRVGGQSCALILTSRLNDVAAALAPTAEDIYRLPVLSEAAGLELLGKLSPETVAQYPDETRELVRDLEGLPLAIHVAGRLLQTEARLGWGVADLLVELRQGANLLMAQPPSDMIGVERDTSPTVAALLKRSTDALDTEIRSRFALLGLFVPKPATFDLAAMAAAWDVSDPKPVARTLVNRGLLEPVSGGRFQMHALLVLHARSLLETEAGSRG
jgi:DNA-binding SARP family transcriptional activator